MGKVLRRYQLILQMAVGLRSPRVIGAIALLLAASAAWAVRALEVQVLRSTGGLAAEVVWLFREPAACQTLVDGSYFVFDRAGHRVYRVPPSDSEAGNIIIPSAFALAGDRFIVADAPREREQVQLFGFDGGLLSSFSLPGRATARITQGRLASRRQFAAVDWSVDCHEPTGDRRCHNRVHASRPSGPHGRPAPRDGPRG